MTLSVNVQKLLKVEVSILLCRGQTFMSEEFLDNPEICPPAQQMRSKGMSQGMGAYLSAHSGNPDILVDCPFDRPRR